MPKSINLIGQKFGRWTVLERAENSVSRDSRWLCKCDCGTEKIVYGKNLRNGRSTSCGCYKKELNKQAMIEKNKQKALDISQDKYGMLQPLEPTEQRTKQGSIIWKCQCDCGNITYVSVDALRGQHPIRSCGCLHRSFGEQEIEHLLKENAICYKKEYQVDKIGRYDFAILKNNTPIRLIEFDGEQHYKNIANWDSLELQQKRDQVKNEYALSHNIPLVRIPYWERDKITLDMIMGDQYEVPKSVQPTV